MKKLILFLILIQIFNILSQDPQQLAKNWYDTRIKKLDAVQKKIFADYINAMIAFTKNSSNSNQFQLNKIKSFDLKGQDDAIGELWGITGWRQGDYSKAATILPAFKAQLQQSFKGKK